MNQTPKYVAKDILHKWAARGYVEPDVVEEILDDLVAELDL